MLALLLEQLDDTPLWLVGSLLLSLMVACLLAGRWVRVRLGKSSAQRTPDSSFDGYIVSAVLGLLALLLAFSFSLAIQRFEERRQLVVSEANAIGTAYLRAQMLGSPYRQRLSKLILSHLDNEIRLAETGFPETSGFRQKDDEVLTQIWAVTVSALSSPRTMLLSISLTNAMNSMIDLNTSRRAARAERIPSRVFAVLWAYLLSVAGVLGYEMNKGKRAFLAYFVLGLMSISLLLVLDIDRPTSGLIGESQKPMLQLRGFLIHQP